MRPRLLISLSHLACPSPYLTRPYSTTASSPSLLKITNLSAPHTGTIRIISLNSPRNRNAISWRLLRELTHEVNILRDAGDEGPTQEGGVRALVVASELDEVFCAGADLKERRNMGVGELVGFSFFASHEPSFYDFIIHMPTYTDYLRCYQQSHPLPLHPPHNPHNPLHPPPPNPNRPLRTRSRRRPRTRPRHHPPHLRYNRHHWPA